LIHGHPLPEASNGFRVTGSSTTALLVFLLYTAKHAMDHGTAATCQMALNDATNGNVFDLNPASLK